MYNAEVSVTDAQSSRRGVDVYPVRRPLRTVLEVEHGILLATRAWCPIRKRQMVGRFGSLIAALHSRGVVHGSICPSSIIYCSTRDCLQLQNAGLYRAAQAYTPLLLLPELSRYAAPEVLTNDNFIQSKEADVYAWACVTYAIYIGYAVFRNWSPSKCVVIIEKEGHTRLQKPTDMQDDLWDIIHSCWNVNANLRPSIETIVSALRF